MKLLLLSGAVGAAARIVPHLPAGAEVEVRTAGAADPTPVAGLDVALACDAEGRSMLGALPAEVARVAFVAAYGAGEEGQDDRAEVDLWAVGHEAVARGLRARGVDEGCIAVTGIPVPAGFGAPADRASARAAAGLPDDELVAVVRTEIAADDLGPLLVQLTLLDRRPWILFDVGEDADAAARLRAEVPRSGLRAKMFAAGADAGRFSALGDLVVGPPDPFDVARAFACGAASVVLGRPARGALDAVVESGAARVSLAVSRLAADIDLLRAPERLEAARAAARAAAAPQAAPRLAEVLARAAADRTALASRRRRQGLPVGLEDLSGPDAALPPPPRRPEPDLDEELAALRRKIGKA